MKMPMKPVPTIAGKGWVLTDLTRIAWKTHTKKKILDIMIIL